MYIALKLDIMAHICYVSLQGIPHQSVNAIDLVKCTTMKLSRYPRVSDFLHISLFCETRVIITDSFTCKAKQSKVMLWAGGKEEGRKVNFPSLFSFFLFFSEPGGWFGSRDASSFHLHNAKKESKKRKNSPVLHTLTDEWCKQR